MTTIYDEAKEMEKSLISWRRALHQIPEIGLRLPKTVSYICRELEKMGIHYEKYEDISCILVTLGQGSPCILLRGDMDALPIREPEGLEFASTNGCMHGCGKCYSE